MKKEEIVKPRVKKIAIFFFFYMQRTLHHKSKIYERNKAGAHKKENDK